MKPPRFAVDAAPAAMLQAFLRDGLLVVEGFIDRAHCESLVAHAGELVRRLARPSGTVFSTRTHEHAAADDFLDSAGEVRVFEEEEARDEAGALQVAPERAVNKIGHALHDRDPPFAALSRNARMERVLRIIGLADPVLIQSMLIFKQPGIGGEVVWHQDASFLYTDPISVTGLWLALEHATLANGCLWARPGAHRGPLRKLFAHGEDGLALRTVDANPWPDGEAVPLEVPAGTLVALNGLLPHRSEANRSQRSRLAYTLHAIDRRARYPRGNWLQRGAADPARGFESR